MQNLKRKSIYWLVIVAMVLQPIAFSFAMTSMQSMQAEAESVAMSNMVPSTKYQPTEIANTNCHMAMADESASSNTLDSCCGTAACCFAYPSVHFFQLPVLPHSIDVVLNYSFTNTDITIKTKPPKPLSA